MTSDERREVARKIREYVNAYGDKIEDAKIVLLGTVCFRGEVGEVVRPTSEVELLAMVADLIDPVCYPVIPDETEGYVFCSKCGAEIGEYGVPNYCPNCGAKVVDE